MLHAAATALPFSGGQFSAATLFTMLHHVPSAALQDRMLAEVRRVLRPGGVLAGADGVATPAHRELHVDDDYLPVDPATMAGRLGAAGFAGATVEVHDDRFRSARRCRFSATVPVA